MNENNDKPERNGKISDFLSRINPSRSPQPNSKTCKRVDDTPTKIYRVQEARWRKAMRCTLLTLEKKTKEGVAEAAKGEG
jgi:hypothetical protein